jgi:UrcA family protein
MKGSNQRFTAGLTAAVIIAVLLGLMSAARSAESGVRLDVHRSDLSKPEVVAQVYARIEKAAGLVCKDSSSPWDGGRMTTWKRCVAAAVDGAVLQANAPELTAMHQLRKARAAVASYQGQAARPE